MITGDDDNPYVVLGVEVDADEAAVKAAYRRLARRWHPDHCKEPNAEMQFCRVQAAYDLLMDANQRAHYDRTGVRGEASVDPGARENLIGICIQWAQNVDYRVDFRVVARNTLTAQATQIAAEIEKGKVLVAMIAKKVKRITRRTDGTNYLTIALETRAAELNENIANAARLLRTTKRALEMIEDFDYDPTPDMQRTLVFNTFNTFG